MRHSILVHNTARQHDIQHTFTQWLMLDTPGKQGQLRAFEHGMLRLLHGTDSAMLELHWSSPILL